MPGKNKITDTISNIRLIPDDDVGYSVNINVRLGIFIPMLHEVLAVGTPIAQLMKEEFENERD